MSKPNVINTERRTILNKKSEEKNTVNAMMIKKSISSKMFFGSNVLTNHPKILNPQIPKINHNMFLFGRSIELVYQVWYLVSAWKLFSELALQLVLELLYGCLFNGLKVCKLPLAVQLQK